MLNVDNAISPAPTFFFRSLDFSLRRHRIDVMPVQQRFALRMPKALHRSLRKRAKAGGISLNALVVLILQMNENGRRGPTTTTNNPFNVDLAPTLGVPVSWAP